MPNATLRLTIKAPKTADKRKEDNMTRRKCKYDSACYYAGKKIGGCTVADGDAYVVLMKSRLSDVPAAIRMSRATLRNIHENLFWAFF